ncbi:hydroxymethylglutaryl-CoA synthase-like [Saccostrea echinata]|uniref:hydroxymethylglutaryl-CoA synthase-like n=1 Tax=Saccostrea echinata TaxID=191078 RepID=UPI002A7FF7BA|nr:hydroxymethylglutaryl-CoA synthase-like [Saccostrea echinata]
MAALDSAIDWVAAGWNQGRKALVIAADFSRVHLNTKQEFVMGGVATAMLISDQPEIIESLNWVNAATGPPTFMIRIDLQPGRNWGTTKPASLRAVEKKKSELRADFERKVLPALRISRLVGSCYASSNYAGIVSLLLSCEDLEPGDRIGFYAYGSGAIGEFYSAIVCPGAREKLQKLQMLEKLEARYDASVAEYEQNEAIRDSYVENPDFEPDFSRPPGVFEKYYRGQGLYVLKSVKEYQRKYEWS